MTTQAGGEHAGTNGAAPVKPAKEPMTIIRAAQRYAQIRQLEREVRTLDLHIADAKDALKELRKNRDGLIAEIRKAARDDGQLPLFDVESALGREDVY